MKMRISGAWRDCTAAKVKVAGVWRNVTRIMIKQGGAWKEAKIFAPPLDLTTSAPSVEAYNYSGFPSYVVTPSITAIPSGGTPPFTYAWTRDTGTATATSPATATSGFGRVVNPGEDSTEFWTVTATDSFGLVGVASISARFVGDIL